VKLLGLIGGVSPASTVIYYRLLNEAAKARLGGDHSQRQIIWSFDFHAMHDIYRAEDWDLFKRTVAGAGLALKAAGADAILICSNTVSMAADDVAGATGLPVINLMGALARAMAAAGAKKPLLLGTPVVMEGDFYRPALRAQYGVETLVPSVQDREIVRRVIFDELVNGVVLDQSRRAYADIIKRGVDAGADSVILGCTEIGMLISAGDVDLPAFDTTLIHAAAASAFVFGEA